MKNKRYKVLITIVIVCFSCTYSTYGQNDTIYVSKDTTIIFSDIQSNKNVNVYGNVGGQSYYDKLKEANSSMAGIEPQIIDPGHKAAINIVFDQLFPDTSVYYYYRAEFRSTGKKKNDGTDKKSWYPEQNPSLKVVIVKIKRDIFSTIKSEDSTEKISYEISSTSSDISLKTPNKGTTWYWIVLCFVFMTTVVCLYLVINQKKKINNILDDISQIKNDKACHMQVISEERVREIANETTEVWLKSFKEGLSLQHNLKQENLRTQTDIPQTNRMSKITTPKEIDTSDVVYNESSNTFTIEPTSISHFRIYSKSNTIYYTINSNILGNEEAVSRWYGNIGTYKACIKCSDNPIAPKKITIIKDGELRQAGANYEVLKPMEISLQ